MPCLRFRTARNSVPVWSAGGHHPLDRAPGIEGKYCMPWAASIIADQVSVST